MIIPSLFFGDILYFSNIVQCSNFVIDDHEHFIKQSQRNHTKIIGPNGIQKITIPVSYSGKEKTKDISIDTKSFSAHLHSISTAYGASPFFESLYPLISDLLEVSYQDLGNLNRATFHLICSILEIENSNYSDGYIESTKESLDLREHFKNEKIEIDLPEYYQVFKSKHGFIPNLSILDLIFNEGKWARNYLESVPLNAV